MPVPYPPLLHSLVEELLVNLVEPVCPIPYKLVVLSRYSYPHELLGLLEVFVGVELHNFWLSELVHPVRREVKPCYPVRHPSDLIFGNIVQPVGEYPAVGDPPHLHRVLNHLCAILYHPPSVTLAYGNYSHINPGTEPTVENHLLLAVIPSLFKGGVVKKTKVHGLLYLIDYVF